MRKCECDLIGHRCSTPRISRAHSARLGRDFAGLEIAPVRTTKRDRKRERTARKAIARAEARASVRHGRAHLRATLRGLDSLTEFEEAGVAVGGCERRTVASVAELRILVRAA